MNKKIAIISNFHHPFYEKLKVLKIPFYECDHCFEKNSDWSAYEYIFDFTVLSTVQKKSLYTNITTEIISDLTFNWGELLLNEFQNIKGAFATALYSPNNTYEVYISNEEINKVVDELFSNLNIKIQLTNNVGFGFTFPRILSQIINEAYFSLDDELASGNDIDTAMKFGVNYPLGPIEWSQKTNLKNILNYLNELQHYTGDSRYRSSLALQKACL